MSSELDNQFIDILTKYKEVAQLRKYWKLKDLFSNRSPHIIFIIQYYVIKHIYEKNKLSPKQEYQTFMKSLARNLALLKGQIEGNDHKSKIEKIRTSVLSFFGNCQEMDKEQLYSDNLSQK